MSLLVRAGVVGALVSCLIGTLARGDGLTLTTSTVLPSTSAELTTRPDMPGYTKLPEGAPDGWGEKFYEWTMPRTIYVRGNPLLLNDQNSAASKGRRVNFVACPVIMDSNPTPLWLAQYDGETYFLRTQQNGTADVHTPQLLHKVLVEGIVSNEPRIAGGVVLNPLKLSVLREVDDTCKTILPAQPGYSVPFALHPPGPGASVTSRYKNFYGAEYALQKVNFEIAANGTRTYNLPFDFDNDYVNDAQADSEFNNDTKKIIAAAKYARESGAAKIEVHGYRGSALLSNGKLIREYEGIEKVRAEKVAVWLNDYFFKESEMRALISVDWSLAPIKADGIHDFDSWRATIVVVPKSKQVAGVADTHPIN